jgi:DNA-binding MurR/RpiR family transcriptional regulator
MKLCFIVYNNGMKIIAQMESMHQKKGSDAILAAYILANREEVLGMTVRELALSSFTSSSSVVRFCRHLGLSGYGDFKIRFAREMEQELVSVSNVDANFPFGPDDSIETISARLSSLVRDSLTEAQQLLSSSLPDFQKAVIILQNADRKGIFGLGDAYLCGLAFQAEMMRAGFTYLTTPIYGEQGHLTEIFSERDAALLLSYSGTTEKIVECAQTLKKRHVQTIAITSGKDSPIAHIADVVLLLPERERKFHRLANFSSNACMEYYLNVLYSALCVGSYDQIAGKSID